MLRLLTIALCVVAAGAGLAVAAVGIPGPPDKAAALQRLVSVATTDSSTEPADPPDSAPLGSSVETSAQTGFIRVRTAAGRTLHLDLATGQVGRG